MQCVFATYTQQYVTIYHMVLLFNTVPYTIVYIYSVQQIIEHAQQAFPIITTCTTAMLHNSYTTDCHTYYLNTESHNSTVHCTTESGEVQV